MVKIRLFTVLFCLALLGTFAIANPLDTLQIVGNRTVATNELMDATIGASDPAWAVADYYRQLGYWQAAVTESTVLGPEGKSQRWITIKEGPLHTVRLDGGPAISAAFLQERFQQRLAQEAESGHPMATLRPEGAQVSVSGRVDLRTAVESGPVWIVGQIRVVGSTITRSEVVGREARITPGSVYRHSAVTAWMARLRRLDIFESVSGPVLVVDSVAQSVDLVVWVKEGKPNRFEGVVGYQPGGSGEGGVVTGLINLRLGNLWGSGRSFDGRWERVRPKESRFDLRYREPWVAGLPVNLEGRLAIEQRVAFIRDELELSGQMEPYVGTSIGASVGRETVKSDSIILLGGPRSRATTLGVSASFDTRDHPNNPRSGLYYRGELDWAFKNNRIDDPDFVKIYGVQSGLYPKSARRSRIGVDLNHFIPINGSLVAHIGIHGREVKSSDTLSVDESEKLRLGGARTVRGFTEDQFLGSRMLWANLEARLLVGPRSRFFVFTDLAQVHSKNGEESWYMSYGTGLRAQTPGGQLGVDLGWGLGDSFGDGKIHVSYINRF